MHIYIYIHIYLRVFIHGIYFIKVDDSILQGCVLWIGLSCAVVLNERSFSTHSRPRTMLDVPGYLGNWVQHLATRGHTDATAGRVRGCAQLLCALLSWRAARQAAIDSREIPGFNLGMRLWLASYSCPVHSHLPKIHQSLPTSGGRFESLIFEHSRAICSRNGGDSRQHLFVDRFPGGDWAAVAGHCHFPSCWAEIWLEFPPLAPWDSMGVWAHPCDWNIDECSQLYEISATSYFANFSLHFSTPGTYHNTQYI